MLTFSPLREGRVKSEDLGDTFVSRVINFLEAGVLAAKIKIFKVKK